MEAESVKIEALKVNLERKSQEVDQQMSKFTKQLQEKLKKPDEDFKVVLTMEDSDFKKYLDEQIRLVNDWKESTMSLLKKEEEAIANKLKVATIVEYGCWYN